MRIAQVAPLIESVPPKHYGGTERIVSYLTEELVRAGHDVTLFGSGDSVIGGGSSLKKAELDPVGEIVQSSPAEPDPVHSDHEEGMRWQSERKTRSNV